MFNANQTPSEITVDNFAGGGGASTGIAMGLGREIDIAINHNEEALDMHARNHPGTTHLCESVFDVDPDVASKGRPVGLCWLSPDCRHHSRAKGGKPREQNIRGLAWIALRWAVSNSAPRIFMLENVPEFQEWSPLDEVGHPIKSRKGETFKAFVSALSTGLAADHPAVTEIQETLGEDFPIDRIVQGLGYRVEYRELRASDYGAPTIRKRFFLVARRDGLPIVWPAPTHGDPAKEMVKAGLLKPWRTAAECIDWSIPTNSIFERKRPLAHNTMRRIAKGVQRYVLEAAKPFIVSLAHGEVSPSGVKRWGSGVRDLDLPLQTVLASGNGASLVQPFLIKFRTGSTGQALNEPMATITSGGNSRRPAGAPHALGLVEAQLQDSAFIVPIAHYNGSEPVHSMEDPLRTITASPKGGAFALASASLMPCAVEAQQACLLKYYGNDKDGTDIQDPLHTITSKDRFGLVTVQSAAIMTNTSDHPGASVDAPLPTVTTGNHHYILAPTLIQTGYGERDGQEPRSLDIEKPLGTVVAGGAKHALVAASLTTFYGDKTQSGDGRGSSLDQPVRTQTTENRHGLILAHMEQANGGGYQGEGRPITDPVSTVCASGSHQQLVTSELVPADSPASELPAKLELVRAFAREYLGLERLLVTLEGKQFEVTDIGLRMLKPKELFKAQGFPDGYVIEFERKGKMLSASAQVRMCGNSVCPPVAEALVIANMRG